MLCRFTTAQRDDIRRHYRKRHQVSLVEGTPVPRNQQELWQVEMHGPVKVSAAPGQPEDESPREEFNEEAVLIKATAALHRTVGAVGGVPPEE